MMRIFIFVCIVALTSGLSPPRFEPDVLKRPIQSSAATPGYLVGMTYAVDDDGDSITYTLLNDDAVYFNIDAGTGKITVSSTAIPTGKIMMVFSVKAVDSNSMESVQPVVVYFEDLLVNTC